MTLKRSYCNICTYPLSVCICDAIVTIHCPIKIMVLQHPLESKHAKNSARLLPLCLDNVELYLGESAGDFLQIAKACHLAPQEFAVFYPSEYSTALEPHLSQFKQNMPSTLIFIDATWRKALKIWKLNPWLHSLNCWHFATPPSSRYQIRKASVDNSLSTLEAVAYALQQSQGIDCQPLHDIFSAMQGRVFWGNVQIKNT
jgi:DTW domain-containing protein YfiP